MSAPGKAVCSNALFSKGASHDTTSSTHDRGYAGEESLFADPWPAPDRRTLAEAHSCPCRAAHFELRSFHDSAGPPRTLELLRLCFCIRYSIPWVIPRRGV